MNEKVKNRVNKNYWFSRSKTSGSNNIKLKPYPKYKESRIQWIGQIPVDWKINKVKYLVDKSVYYPIGDGDHGQITPDMYQDKGVPYIRVQNLSWNGEILFKGMVYISEEINLANKKSILKPQDLLIAKTGATIGKIGFMPKNINLANTTSSVGKITINKKIHSPFFWNYYFQSDIFQNQIFISAYQKSAQPGFNIEDLVDFIVIIPSFKEQFIISNFLDKKIAELDKLIEKDKKLIGLLKEKRAALINHAVTKGLDPNVKLKDSGIDWIGEIPEGWEVNKIKNTNYVKGRIGWHGLTSEEYQDEGAFLVTGTDFFNGHIDWSSCHHISWERYKEDPYIHLKENDVLITKDGTIGKVALIEDLPDKATLNSGVFVIRALNKKHISHFMFWILNSLVFEKFFDYVKRGATISHLYQETFERFIFPIPSLDEQKAIAEYLDKFTARIDKTIQKNQKKIKILEEYKKSLIHHTVTGKIDVREV